MKFIKKAKRGFTLVELVVVIAVIAILAAVSVGAYFGITDSANKSKLESEARGILTNIQLIANGNDSNCYMDREGIHIKEGGLEAFETKLNGMSGIDYEIINQAPTSVSKQTVYFIDTKEVSSAAASFETYYRYAYYTPDVGGKCAVYTFETNELKVTDANFDVTQPDSPTPDAPAPEVTVNSVSIEIDGINKDTHEFYIGQTANISITTDPANIDYTYSFSVPGIVDYSGGALVEALAAGTTIFTVASKDDNTKTDSVTFTVKENAVTGIIRTDDNVCKTNYFEGETFDPTGLQLALEYEIGDPVPVNMSEVTYDKTTLNVGDNVVCTYGEYTYTLELDVQAIKLDSITCNKSSVDTQYYVGDEFNPSELEFTAHYNYGNPTVINIEDIEFNSEISKSQTSIRFSYPKDAEPEQQKFVDITLNKAVLDVLPKSLLVDGNIKTSYNAGEKVSKEGLSLKLEFNKPGVYDENLDLNKVISEPEEINSDTTQVRYGYQYDENTVVYSDYIDVEVSDIRQVYAKVPHWFLNADAVPYVFTYKGNDSSFEKVGDPIVLDAHTKVKSVRLGGENSDLDYRYYSFEVDLAGLSGILFERWGDSSDDAIDGNVYWNSQSLCIPKESITEINNMILLSESAKYTNSNDNELKGRVEFNLGTYTPNTTEGYNIKLLGANGSWEVEGGQAMASEGDAYTIKNVELLNNRPFKFYNATTDEWFGYDSLNNTNGIPSELYDTGSSNNHNIGINKANEGTYNLSLKDDLSVELEFISAHVHDYNSSGNCTCKCGETNHSYSNEHECTKCSSVEDGYRAIYVDVTDKSTSNAWFWVDTWNSGGNNLHVRGKLVSGNIYKFIISTAQTGMKVYRMNPANSSIDYNEGVWNKTGNIQLVSNKNKWTWAQGKWSDYTSTTWSTY